MMMLHDDAADWEQVRDMEQQEPIAWKKKKTESVFYALPADNRHYILQEIIK